MATDKKAIIRGKILYYLALIYPQAATLPLLQGELDLFGYPMPMEDLKFHLCVLVEKEMVSLEDHIFPKHHGSRPNGQGRKVTLVKITAKGIDYHDGRLPANPGIYVDPKA